VISQLDRTIPAPKSDIQSVPEYTRHHAAATPASAASPVANASQPLVLVESTAEKINWRATR